MVCFRLPYKRMEVYRCRYTNRTIKKLPAGLVSLKEICGDLWLRRGISNFTTFLACGGKPFHLDYHLKRLRAGCRAVAIPFPPFLVPFLGREVARLLRSRKDAKIEITVTPGASPDGWRPQGNGSIFIFIEPFPKRSGHAPTRGKIVKTVPYRRPGALVKDRNYRVAWSAYHKARMRGGHIDDVLYTDGDELIELSRSNIFFVRGETLFTPPHAKALPGITRKIVMDLARHAGFRVVTRPVYRADLTRFTEAFATSSISGIVPILQIDGHRIGRRKAGLITRQLSQLFEDYSRSYFMRK